MNASSEKTLPRWIALTASQTGAETGARQAPTRNIKALKRSQAQIYRLRLALAVSFSVGFHVILLFGFNQKPVKAADPALKSKIPVELFQVPIEEPVITPEEFVESDPSAQVIDVAPPSLPELIRVPLASDFAIAPLPPPPANLGNQAPQLVIPQAPARAGAMADQRIFTIGELDRAPQVLASVNPTYPIELASSNIHGQVVVRFVVNSRGDILHPEVVSSPHPALGTAVVRALARWRFKAGMKGGRAVSTDIELPVLFDVNQG